MQSIIQHEFNEHLKVSKATFESIGNKIEVARYTNHRRAES